VLQHAVARQPTGFAPADDAIAPQHRQRVVAELPLRQRRVGLEAYGQPRIVESTAVPHYRIERRQQRTRSSTVARSGRSAAGQYQSTPSIRAPSETRLGARQRRLQVDTPLRGAVAQACDHGLS
jgi:hypothetical protein